ncbi:MAG: DUF2850 domain-containing protein [Pirellula sp.]
MSHWAIFWSIFFNLHYALQNFTLSLDGVYRIGDFVADDYRFDGTSQGSGEGQEGQSEEEKEEGCQG